MLRISGDSPLEAKTYLIVPVNEKESSLPFRAGWGEEPEDWGALVPDQLSRTQQSRSQKKLELPSAWSLGTECTRGFCSRCLRGDPVFLELCSERSRLILSADSIHGVSTHPC